MLGQRIFQGPFQPGLFCGSVIWFLFSTLFFPYIIKTFKNPQILAYLNDVLFPWGLFLRYCQFRVNPHQYLDGIAIDHFNYIQYRWWWEKRGRDWGCGTQHEACWCVEKCQKVTDRHTDLISSATHGTTVDSWYFIVMYCCWVKELHKNLLVCFELYTELMSCKL